MNPVKTPWAANLSSGDFTWGLRERLHPDHAITIAVCVQEGIVAANLLGFVEIPCPKKYLQSSRPPLYKSMSPPEGMAKDKDAVAMGPLHNEDLEHAATHGTYLDKEEESHLSEEHRQYLLERHGTLDLDPLPTMGIADPYNWPTWKVSAGRIYCCYFLLL